MAKSPLKMLKTLQSKSFVFEQARTKVLVAESSKFSQNANYYLARLDNLIIGLPTKNQARKS